MLPSYLLVGAGLLAGAYVGIFVIEYDPPIVGWFFGTGTGVSLGAFVAALVSNTPLAGRAPQPSHRAPPLDDFDAWDEQEPPERR